MHAGDSWALVTRRTYRLPNLICQTNLLLDVVNDIPGPAVIPRRLPAQLRLHLLLVHGELVEDPQFIRSVLDFVEKL